MRYPLGPSATLEVHRVLSVGELEAARSRFEGGEALASIASDYGGSTREVRRADLLRLAQLAGLDPSRFEAWLSRQ